MEFEEVPIAQTSKPAPLSQEQMQQSFTPIEYASSSIVIPPGNYRVYYNRTSFKKVHANSAYEAMQKTNIDKPVKIIRHSLNRMSVLTQEVLRNGNTIAEASTPTPVQTPIETPSPVVEQVELPTEEDAQTRGLDGNEVDALLVAKED